MFVLYQGPLVVVLKVASSLVAEPAKFWPPALPDCVETIAASYYEFQYQYQNIWNFLLKMQRLWRNPPEKR